MSSQSSMERERDIRKALGELVDVIKIHKVSVLQGMTRRETELLTDALHKANVALSDSRADARLIAAAPELLSALKEASAMIFAPAEDLKEGVLFRIREAIAKAS